MAPKRRKGLFGLTSSMGVYNSEGNWVVGNLSMKRRDHIFNHRHKAERAT